MRQFGIVDMELLIQINRLVNENAALKKQVRETHLQNVAKDVAVHIDNWMDKPYKKNQSEWEDISELALKITRHVDHKLRN